MPGLEPPPHSQKVVLVAVGLLAALILAAVVVIAIFGSGAGL
jgi:hypothetical protein